MRLRDFLLYVTECALRDAPQDATEQQIGIHVFGRTAGYNSSEDSIVRTQARLLRQRLGAYFATEGAAEDLTLEIPKGQYLPVFRDTAAPLDDLDDTSLADTSLSPFSPSRQQEGVRSSGTLIGVFAALIVGLLLLGGILWKVWPAGPTQAASLERLWRPFLTGEPPLVIYSNAMFLRQEDGALQWTAGDGQETRDSRNQLVDSYTGVGEVIAVHQLTRLFDTSHASFILKRSHLVTWDEARDRNLIFIGAPSQNEALKVVPSTTEFTISPTLLAPGIVNEHPRPGEPALYPREPAPEAHDYAIIALVPGTRSERWMMVLSGLTTHGTEAAAEFAANPDGAAELLRSATKDGVVHPFEAVIEVSVSAGVPVRSRLLTIHVR